MLIAYILTDNGNNASSTSSTIKRLALELSQGVRSASILFARRKSIFNLLVLALEQCRS